MKGRRRAEVNILLRQGLEVFLPARQDFYGADLWRNSRQCLPHRLHGSAFLHFVIGVCALAAGGYEAGKKSGKRKKRGRP